MVITKTKATRDLYCGTMEETKVYDIDECQLPCYEYGYEINTTTITLS